MFVSASPAAGAASRAGDDELAGTAGAGPGSAALLAAPSVAGAADMAVQQLAAALLESPEPKSFASDPAKDVAQQAQQHEMQQLRARAVAEEHAARDGQAPETCHPRATAHQSESKIAKPIG